MEFQDWLFDKRVMRRNQRRGLITEDDYQAYLKSLPDVSDNMMTLEEDEIADEEARVAREAEAEAAALEIAASEAEEAAVSESADE